MVQSFIYWRELSVISTHKALFEWLLHMLRGIWLHRTSVNHVHVMSDPELDAIRRARLAELRGSSSGTKLDYNELINSW